MFKNWEWVDTWYMIGVAVVLSLIALIGIVTFAPKNVDYYYVSEGRTTTTCIYAHWTWHGDETAFCTDDSAKALDFMLKANQAIAASGSHRN
jgi:hypothetical protein